MTYEKNGINLSIDFMNINRLRQVETALTNYSQSSKMASKDLSAADTLLHYCHEIFVMIDEIYGQGVHEQIFGADVNYIEVVDVYEVIVNGLGEVRIQLAQGKLKMAQVQAERRSRIAELEAEYTRINEENRAALDTEQAKLEAEREEEQAKRDAQQNRNTSVPFSDMSNRPRVPLAVPPAATPSHTISMADAEMARHAHGVPRSSMGISMPENAEVPRHSHALPASVPDFGGYVPSLDQPE